MTREGAKMNQDETATLLALETALEIAESLLLNLAILAPNGTVNERRKAWEDLQSLKEFAELRRKELNEAKP